MPTTFFDLPRELRDEISHWVWLEIPVITLQNTDVVKMSAWYNCSPPFPQYNPGPSLYQNLHRWLRTSTRLQEEGIQAFNRRGVVMIRPATISAPCFCDLPADLSPLAAREIYIFPNVLDNIEKKAGERGITHRYPDFQSTYFRKLISDIATADRMRVLRIGLHVRGYDDLPHDLDLKPLWIFSDVIKRVEELEIVVDELLFYEQARQTFRASLREEIEKLDGDLMKGFIATRASDYCIGVGSKCYFIYKRS